MSVSTLIYVQLNSGFSCNIKGTSISKFSSLLYANTSSVSPVPSNLSLNSCSNLKKLSKIHFETYNLYNKTQSVTMTIAH